VPRRTLGAGPEPVDLAIRLLAVLAVAGILCYGLSRYLTSPVLKLRDAARRLAGGELTVRVDPTLASRSDEFSDLGQDFDVMAERIESLVRSQRRLLSDISHELRSPLSRLKVAVELARRPTGNEAPGYLDRIEREADRMNHLIGQLLSLARLDDETQVQSDEVVALLSLLREIAADAEFEANSCRCTVQLAEARECSVRGSAEILRSALENVVRNAVHYTASGTAVEVALRLHDRGGSSRAIITVRDHGPGVPPESLPYLFRPFYRVGDARDRQSGGSGLGLAIAERAVRLHGGSIEAANAPDGGLVVTVELPVAPSRLAAASPLSGSASESASGFGNMRNQ
jgi:two-component system sensor histidine kinase CpxA